MGRPGPAWIGPLLALTLAGGCAGAFTAREEPGMRPARLDPCPSSPNCVSSQARDAAHRVEPLPVAADGEATMRVLRDIVEAMPRCRVVRAEDGYLHAELRSRIFRFVDDLELLLDAEAGVVHVRSASRTGYSDLGVNRRRVQAIRSALASRSR